MNDHEINIPFIGIVSEYGYIESYDYKTAEKHDFHHSFALSEKGCEIYNQKNTLRFVIYRGTALYVLEGSPSLDPFEKGYDQIKLFVSHALDNGADPELEIEVAEQYLGTKWEGKRIGKLLDWISV